MDKDKQMKFLFEEGGIADDGMNRDPISGNSVPPGSLAEEVRDDIPAHLSEGEYVVPADVVRYYGVKFFEELRGEAKEGLGDMERDGRIGGEPIDMEESLSPEEEAELQSLIGMAIGGFVTEQPTQATDPYMAQTQLYSAPAPIAVGNTMQTRGFQTGGSVPSATQVAPDLSSFRAGFSFMGPQASGGLPVVGTPYSVTLYGPNGEVVSLILPMQQAQYDALINAGYGTTAVAQVQPAQMPASVNDDGGMDSFEAQRQLREAMDQKDYGPFDAEEFNRISSDPIGYADALLSEEGVSARTGLALGVAGGPILGTLAGAALSGAALDNIARARAARNIAASRGLDTTELDVKINTALENLPFGARFLDQLGFGQGTRYTERLKEQLSAAEIRAAYTPPEWMPDGATAATARENANARLRNLAGPAAEYAADQISSGYTGSSVNNIAVGQISGDGQIEGVVANPDGTVVKDSQNRTVYRDAEGKTYVKAGILGSRTEYVSIPEIATNPSATPVAETVPETVSTNPVMEEVYLPEESVAKSVITPTVTTTTITPDFVPIVEQAIAEAEVIPPTVTPTVTPTPRPTVTPPTVTPTVTPTPRPTVTPPTPAVTPTPRPTVTPPTPTVTPTPRPTVTPTPDQTAEAFNLPTAPGDTRYDFLDGMTMDEFNLYTLLGIGGREIPFPPEPEPVYYPAPPSPSLAYPPLEAPPQPTKFPGLPTDTRLSFSTPETGADVPYSPGRVIPPVYTDIRTGQPFPPEIQARIEQARIAEQEALRKPLQGPMPTLAPAASLKPAPRPTQIGYGAGQIDPALARAAGITSGPVPAAQPAPVVPKAQKTPVTPPPQPAPVVSTRDDRDDEPPYSAPVTSTRPTQRPTQKPTPTPTPVPKTTEIGYGAGQIDPALARAAGITSGPVPKTTQIGYGAGQIDPALARAAGITSEPVPEKDDSDSGGGKIICTAMNTSYGFGSYRQAIWLTYSEKHLTDYHEKGYHKLFLPLVDRAYNRGSKNNVILRKILEHGTRHRTADLRAEMHGKKRDTLGRIYRTLFEPLCYVVGRFTK